MVSQGGDVVLWAQSWRLSYPLLSATSLGQEVAGFCFVWRIGMSVGLTRSTQ